VEILQNCNIFNDGAWEPLKDADTSDDYLIRLVEGEQVRFGKDRDKVVVRGDQGHLAVADAATVDESQIIVFDSHAQDPGLAFALSRLADVHSLNDTAIGVFRDVARPSYDRLVREQVASVSESGEGDLAALVRGKDTWTVS
jgi:2-oxoglutarate ferredoxin oxidoreductase subunit beta